MPRPTDRNVYETGSNVFVENTAVQVEDIEINGTDGVQRLSTV